ncbi:XPG N-terminal domain-containing protein [Rhodotorula diobovata]|uniref:XPG N-terminal domain-containing protein n=1 Tax=Rhodotorula diobovata TaxID=5288 RepID=A0A5C5FPR3_9BASI|nr:XPG N-terminal domain-containing protein [Rhodotorula diobovata]
MGVQGLWEIVGLVARPITLRLESLEDKRLAIDAGIWLHQFQMAMRDRKMGDTLHGAHIVPVALAMGTSRRILKLLFHGIKPVFVFDGDDSRLKMSTIEKHKRRKQGAGIDLAKTAQKLLSAQLRTQVSSQSASSTMRAALLLLSCLEGTELIHPRSQRTQGGARGSGCGRDTRPPRHAGALRIVLRRSARPAQSAPSSCY